jgi:hypothetical protein
VNHALGHAFRYTVGARVAVCQLPRGPLKRRCA